jgi:hypothetical protein
MADYFKAIEDARKDPAVLRIARFNHFMLSFEIFVGNYADLKRVLEYHDDPQSSKDLAPLRNRYQVDELYCNVRRYLHNYVASALSLVDHTRNLHKEMSKDGRAIPTFKEEIERRFLKNGLVQFVQGLRNYFLHFSVPRVTSPQRFLNPEPSRVYLLPSDLQRFSGWNGPAKSFLDERSYKVDLHQSIEEYFQQVHDFVNWFESEFRHVHAGDQEVVDTYNSQTGAFWAAMVPAMTSGIWQLTPPYTLAQVENCFAGALSPAEWARVSRLPEDPIVRRDAILEILRKGGVEREDLLSKVRDVFDNIKP